MPDLLRRTLLVALVVAVLAAAAVAGWVVMTADTTDQPRSCRSDIVGTCEQQEYP